MQSCIETNLNKDQFSSSEAQLCEEFTQDLILNNDFEEEDEEFSFMCGEANSSPIAAEDAFVNGQIKPVFPLFGVDMFENLPIKPPVKRVFVETFEEEDDRKVTSSSPGNDEISGPYCEWSNRKAVEVGSSVESCGKSNSTGFSKIWRFKDLMRRSNSAGRDSFVFFNNVHAPPRVEEKFEKIVEAVKVSGKVKKNNKSKTVPLSSHEVYLKSKAKEEAKRRSYLPYRPELMGFFTNVNGGLSKNVHPY